MALNGLNFLNYALPKDRKLEQSDQQQVRSLKHDDIANHNQYPMIGVRPTLCQALDYKIKKSKKSKKEHYFDL